MHEVNLGGFLKDIQYPVIIKKNFLTGVSDYFLAMVCTQTEI